MVLKCTCFAKLTELCSYEFASNICLTNHCQSALQMLAEACNSMCVLVGMFVETYRVSPNARVAAYPVGFVFFGQWMQSVVFNENRNLTFFIFVFQLQYMLFVIAGQTSCWLWFWFCFVNFKQEFVRRFIWMGSCSFQVFRISKPHRVCCSASQLAQLQKDQSDLMSKSGLSIMRRSRSVSITGL